MMRFAFSCSFHRSDILCSLAEYSQCFLGCIKVNRLVTVVVCERLRLVAVFGKWAISLPHSLRYMSVLLVSFRYTYERLCLVAVLVFERFCLVAFGMWAFCFVSFQYVSVGLFLSIVGLWSGALWLAVRCLVACFHTAFSESNLEGALFGHWVGSDAVF